MGGWVDGGWLGVVVMVAVVVCVLGGGGMQAPRPAGPNCRHLKVGQPSSVE